MKSFKLKVLNYDIYFKKINTKEYVAYIPDIPYYFYCNSFFIKKAKSDETFIEKFLIEKIKERKLNIKDKLLKRGLGAVQIKITNFCNLKCIYCFEDCKNNKYINKSEFEKILKELEDFKIDRFVLTGGEPLLNPYIKEFIKMIRDSFGNTEIRIQTNGVLYNKIKTLDIDSNIQFQVSLDHHTKEIHEYLRGKNTFDKVIKTIDYLKSKNAYVIVYSTITNLNTNRFDEFMDFLDKKNIDRYGFSILRLQGCGVKCSNLAMSNDEIFEFYKEVLELRKKYKFISSLDDFIESALGLSVKEMCGAGIYSISIDSELSVYPCQICTDERLKMGNLYRNNLKDIYYNSEISKKIRDLYVNDIEECRNCFYKYMCGGGCLVEKFRVKNTFYTSCVLCDVNKRFFRYLIENKKIVDFYDRHNKN